MPSLWAPSTRDEGRIFSRRKKHTPSNTLILNPFPWHFFAFPACITIIFAALCAGNRAEIPSTSSLKPWYLSRSSRIIFVAAL